MEGEGRGGGKEDELREIMRCQKEYIFILNINEEIRRKNKEEKGREGKGR